jgi:hypothetical protein
VHQGEGRKHDSEGRTRAAKEEKERGTAQENSERDDRSGIQKVRSKNAAYRRQE